MAPQAQPPKKGGDISKLLSPRPQLNALREERRHSLKDAPLGKQLRQSQLDAGRPIQNFQKLVPSLSFQHKETPVLKSLDG
jgi:hypothetical protein